MSLPILKTVKKYLDDVPSTSVTSWYYKKNDWCFILYYSWTTYIPYQGNTKDCHFNRRCLNEIKVWAYKSCQKTHHTKVVVLCSTNDEWQQ